MPPSSLILKVWLTFPLTLRSARRARLEGGLQGTPATPAPRPALAGAGGLLISLLADRRPATAEWIMNIDADRSEPMPSAPRGAGRVLALAAVACLVGAGLLLWARSGDAIFSDLVLSALAWCF
jgi:hypothetical protein